jgi:hypothetical protein
VSPDGGILVLDIAHTDGTAVLFDTQARAAIRVLPLPWPAIITQAEFTPDGGRVALGLGSSADEVHEASVVAFDVRTGRRLGKPVEGELAGFPSDESIALTRDGRLLTLAPGGVARPAPAAAPTSILAAYGRILLAADGDAAFLWDLAARRRVGKPLRLGDETVARGAFAYGGGLVALLGPTGRLGLWEASTQKQLGQVTVVTGTDLLEGSALAPIFVSSAPDESVSVWDLREEALRRIVCRVANRNLTRQEWAQYVGSGEPYRRGCPNLPGPG